MIFYVIDKITNRINPNAILNEPALFLTEQEYNNHKQQWINDNTIINELSAFDENGNFINIIPDNSVLQQNLATLELTYTDGILDTAPLGFELNQDNTLYIEIPIPQNTKYIQTILPDTANYQYYPATNIQKEQYSQDLLAYFLANDNRETIVVIHKNNQNLDNIYRINLNAYYFGKVQELVNNIEYTYIEATGDLLNTFLTQEQNELEQKEIEDLEKAKTDAINYITNTLNNYQIKYLICNVDINDNIILIQNKPIELMGVDFNYTFNLINILDSTNTDPVKVIDLDKTMEIYVPKTSLIQAKTDLSNIQNKQNNLKYAFISAIIYNCNTIEDVNNLLVNFNNINIQDVDNIKDGFITLLIKKTGIIIYDLKQRIDVLLGNKTLEETDITDLVLNFN